MSRTRKTLNRLVVVATAALPIGGVFVACGDDNNNGYATEADRWGVGAQCQTDADCARWNLPDAAIVLKCITGAFKGNYCGVKDCMSDLDCPEHSACVAHTDGVNYCFRICADKPECNLNRDLANEANCSSSVDYVSGMKGAKACVPPSSG